MKEHNYAYEVIFREWRDFRMNSWEVIEGWQRSHVRVKFRRNYGSRHGIWLRIQRAKVTVVITMDADLGQPGWIPNLPDSLQTFLGIPIRLKKSLTVV